MSDSRTPLSDAILERIAFANDSVDDAMTILIAAKSAFSAYGAWYLVKNDFARLEKEMALDKAYLARADIKQIVNRIANMETIYPPALGAYLLRHIAQELQHFKERLDWAERAEDRPYKELATEEYCDCCDEEDAEERAGYFAHLYYRLNACISGFCEFADVHRAALHASGIPKEDRLKFRDEFAALQNRYRKVMEKRNEAESLERFRGREWVPIGSSSSS